MFSPTSLNSRRGEDSLDGRDTPPVAHSSALLSDESDLSFSDVAATSTPPAERRNVPGFPKKPDNGRKYDSNTNVSEQFLNGKVNTGFEPRTSHVAKWRQRPVNSASPTFPSSSLPPSPYQGQHQQPLYKIPPNPQRQPYRPSLRTPPALLPKIKDGDEEPPYYYKYDKREDVPDGQSVGSVSQVSLDQIGEKKPDENPERGNWSGRFDFILSCLGMAVGLGNIWRFPYVCYRNGGGAFFIPYIIMLIFVGIPLFFLELSLGQFTSSGPLTCWKFAPLFKGIGFAQLTTNAFFTIYYNMIMGWALFYLVNSFSSLPWSGCDNKWNTEVCQYRLPDVECSETGLIKSENGTCQDTTQQTIGVWNYTVFQEKTGLSRVLPSQEYYDHEVLQITSGIDQLGGIRWELLGCLFFAWIITFICLVKGIKSAGKVVYFTATFPYIVLLVLFAKGISLPNAGIGIQFYLTPEWHRLGDARVWYDAAVQIFFSLGLSYGSLVTLSSYNKFQNNILRDAMIVSIGNCATSFCAGLVVFSYLGYLAKELNTSVDNVATHGAGLAFVIYPEAVSHLPAASFWAVIFFLMLLSLGIDSQFAAIEMIVTSIVDQLPELRPKKPLVTLIVIVCLFLLGIPLCTKSGIYWLHLMDTYCGGWGIMLIAIIEVIAVSWIYGWERFFSDISLMIGRQPQKWWRYTWQFAAPFLLLVILVFSWVDYNSATYGQDYTYPVWADVLGWLMSFASVLWVPSIALYKICREEGTIQERLRYLTLPTEEWGPALVQHRRLVDYVSGFVVDPWKSQTSHKTRVAFQNWGMSEGGDGISHARSQDDLVGPPRGLKHGISQDSVNVSVISDTWRREQSGVFGSVGSLNNLSNPGRAFLGSQMSIGGLSTVSYESGV